MGRCSRLDSVEGRVVVCESESMILRFVSVDGLPC